MELVRFVAGALPKKARHQLVYKWVVFNGSSFDDVFEELMIFTTKDSAHNFLLLNTHAHPEHGSYTLLPFVKEVEPAKDAVEEGAEFFLTRSEIKALLQRIKHVECADPAITALVDLYDMLDDYMERA